MADLSASLGTRRELRVPNGIVEYHERGEGDPVVFVHGLLVHGGLWRKVVPEVAGSARCITPHWPLGSHRRALDGDADLTPAGLARHVVDVLDGLGIERATLVGNDTGGGLCQIVAARHPDRVARLVLTDCDAFENFPPVAFRYLQWAARVPGGLFALMQSMRIPGMARTPIAFGWLTKRRIEKAVLRSYVAPVLSDAGVRRDVAKVLRGLDPKFTLDAAEKLTGFRRPALIAWAPEDRFFPIAHGERLAALLPDARLVRIPDSRTFVSEDNPAAVAEALRSFLAETSGAADGASATPAAAA